MSTGYDIRMLHALVLAGGDGKRLQPYLHEFKGKSLPKQFINIIGRHSMLEHTFRRVEQLIPPERVLTIVTRKHLSHAEVRRQLASRDHRSVIVQPSNKETGPGILLPLAFIYKRFPDAIVGLFPSDHFVLQQARFMSYVENAALAVKHDPARIVLLGIEPHAPESEYGYIVPRKGSGAGRLFGALPVSSFVEKPNPELAAELIAEGALWNTMTIVFSVRALWDLARKVDPRLYATFCGILQAIGTADENRAIEQAYDGLQPVNFSKDIIEKIASDHSESIAVLPVHGVFWSDLGCRKRVLQVTRILSEQKSARWAGPGVSAREESVL
jgi:mannose-1-phosphate guanylyltransferase